MKRDIFGQILRMEDDSLIYFEQIVSFCAIMYLLNYKITQVVLWKLKPEFGKFYR